MKKIALAAAAGLMLAGCGANENQLVNPEGFVIEHLALDVADPDATVAWWCENLGFTVTARKNDAAHTIFVVDASGRMAIEFYRAQTQPCAPDYASMDPLTFHIGFSSKDVDADIERLTKAGAKAFFYNLFIWDRIRPGCFRPVATDPAMARSRVVLLQPLAQLVTAAYIEEGFCRHNFTQPQIYFFSG